MKKHILVVDDSEALRQSLHYILQEHGYSVYEAMNEEEGMLTLHSEHIDLVIADDHRPFLNIEDFVRNLKNDPSFKNLPVVSLGNMETPEVSDDASVFDGIIMKPFSSDTLLHEVRRLCG